MTTQFTQPPAQRAYPGQARRAYNFKRHDDLLDVVVPGGPRDRWSINEVLDLVPTLPNWPRERSTNCYGHRARNSSGARTVLDWLLSHPGDGWQDRWVSSGADEGVDRILTATAGDTRKLSTRRNEIVSGLTCLLLCRMFLPSYDFLAGYRATVLYTHVRQVFRPDLFAKVDRSRSCRHSVVDCR